jgi:hypothetical protein
MPDAKTGSGWTEGVGSFVPDAAHAQIAQQGGFGNENCI